MQHAQTVPNDAVASLVGVFAASEADCVLLDVPASSDVGGEPNPTPTAEGRGNVTDIVVPIADEVGAKGEASAPPRADPQESPWSANIALVSDYRIGGVTSSGHGGALQGGIDYAGPSGWSSRRRCCRYSRSCPSTIWGPSRSAG